jgi:hypothetical protein
MFDFMVGVGVRPAHKAVSDQSNIKIFLRHFSDSLFNFLT